MAWNSFTNKHPNKQVAEPSSTVDQKAKKLETFNYIPQKAPFISWIDRLLPLTNLIQRTRIDQRLNTMLNTLPLVRYKITERGWDFVEQKLQTVVKHCSNRIFWSWHWGSTLHHSRLGSEYIGSIFFTWILPPLINKRFMAYIYSLSSYYRTT